MGEAAEAFLWGEMNGRDMTDPEDWLEFHEDSKPMEPTMIADDARMLLFQINEWADDEALERPSTAELLECLFPKLGADQSRMIADGLQLLAAQADEEI